MKKIEILNGNGKTVGIEVKENNYDTLVPIKVDDNVYCIACGSVPSSIDQLEVINVGVQHIKNWLKERDHHAKETDNVLLCEQCQEEAIY